MSLYVLTSLVALGSMVTPGATLTVPKGIEKRAPGDTMAEPIQMHIDCSGGPRVCNVDCHAILCLLAPNPVQYGGTGANTENRKWSGYTIFKHGQQDREERHVFVDDSVLQQVGNSGEESINANTRQSGIYEMLYPVDVEENSNVGRSIGGQLRSLHVGVDQWYFKNFENYPAGTAGYCDYLQRDPYPSFEEWKQICTLKGKAKDDPARTAVRRDWTQKGPNGKNMYKMMDWDAGDRWPGKGFLDQISRRDPTEHVDGPVEHVNTPTENVDSAEED